MMCSQDYASCLFHGRWFVLQFVLVETVTTSFLDMFPKTRKFKAFVVMCFCAIFFLLGLTLTTDVSSNGCLSPLVMQLYDLVVHQSVQSTICFDQTVREQFVRLDFFLILSVSACLCLCLCLSLSLSLSLCLSLSLSLSLFLCLCLCVRLSVSLSLSLLLFASPYLALSFFCLLFCLCLLLFLLMLLLPLLLFVFFLFLRPLPPPFPYSPSPYLLPPLAAFPLHLFLLLLLLPPSSPSPPTPSLLPQSSSPLSSSFSLLLLHHFLHKFLTHVTVVLGRTGHVGSDGQLRRRLERPRHRRLRMHSHRLGVWSVSCHRHCWVVQGQLVPGCIITSVAWSSAQVSSAMPSVNDINSNNNDNNNNTEILIKREPTAYTGSRGAVQKKQTNRKQHLY